MLVGLDQLFSGQATATVRKRLRDARLGVLTHGAAVDRRGLSTLRVLDELGIAPVRIFAPEHGLEGVAQAEEPVPSRESARDGASAPVLSLYGTTRESLTPKASDLAELDVLLVDLVDVGSRYYTYAWTALLAARAAREAGVHTLVLDRPNPLSGDPSTIEGAPQGPDFLSFVGLEPLPIRHALTLAELLCHFLALDGAELGPDGALSVAGVAGWERFRTAKAHNRPFVPPSPNMPTLETALVYPGGCLLEGTNLSEGRGTTSPFQTVGAPFLDGEKLAADLRELGTLGAWVRPVQFVPTFNKHQGELCSGVMIHVTDPTLFRPVGTYLRLIALAYQQAPEKFRFLERTYEFESDRLAFDLLTGSSAARAAILDGRSAEEVAELVVPVDQSFRELVTEAEARAARAAG